MQKLVIQQGNTIIQLDVNSPITLNVVDIPEVSITPTKTPHVTPTPSITMSNTRTPRITPTPSITMSNTRTPKITPTPSISRSTTRTPAISMTPTPSPRANTTNSIDAMYSSDFVLNSSVQSFTQPSLALPSKGDSIFTSAYTDPVFGTKIVRATALNDITDNVGHLRHDYSRRHLWNCDTTKYIVQASNGYWYLYDANSLKLLDGGRTTSPGARAMIGFAGDCEPFWHPTNPNKIWHTDINGSMRWVEFDCNTHESVLLFDLTDKIHALGGDWLKATRAWTKSEGRPSNDGQWWALLVQDAGFNPIGFIMYDKISDKIVGSLECTNMPDHISTSPLGNYAVISWYGNADADLATMAARPLDQLRGGVRAYDREFKTFTPLSVLGEHSDLAIDAEGNEVFVMVTYHGQNDGVTDGTIFYRIIDTGKAYSLPINVYGNGTLGAGIHISGCADLKPGWIAVEKYTGVGTGAYDGQVLAIQLVPNNPKIYHLAHHRTIGSVPYYSEPHACVNRDFTRVAFSTDWGGTIAPQDFHILLPSWVIK